MSQQLAVKSAHRKSNAQEFKVFSVHDKRLCQTAPSFPDSVVSVALCSASALLLSLCAVSALVVSLVSVDLYLYLILYVENVYPEKDMMQYCNLSHQYLVCHIPFRGLKLSAGYLNFRIPFFLQENYVSAPTSTSICPGPRTQVAPVALRLLRAHRRSIVVGCGVLRAPPPQVLPPLQIIHSAVCKARPGNVTCTEKSPATPRQYTADTRLQSPTVQSDCVLSGVSRLTCVTTSCLPQFRSWTVALGHLCAVTQQRTRSQTIHGEPSDCAR